MVNHDFTNFILLYFSDKSKTIIKIKGNRRTVGGILTKNIKQYTDFQLLLSKGDGVFLTTDGFADQHNKQRKRFGTRRLIEALEKNLDEPMQMQKILLEKELKEWQGIEEQRDDIVIVGIKLR